MAKTIKILQICSYYYGTKLYKNLVENLIQNGTESLVYVPCSYSYNYNETENYVMQAKCFNNWDRLAFYYKYKKVYNNLISNINVEDYELIHAHSLFANGYIAYRLHEKYKIPYVVAVRNTDINVFFKYFIYLRKLGVEITKNASKIVLISNSYKTKLLKYIPKEFRDEIEKRIIVIPNGIDEYFIKNHQVEKKKINSKLNLVYTGRVDKNKNVITTIKCCKKMIKENYDVTLNIIGDITSKKYKRILPKCSFVRYFGRKGKEEIVEIYKDMNIFVMPSKHETFGLTYVEAMSQGIPVIYTKDEGFDGFFEDGKVGYSIKYNDYIDMSDKIKLIIKNYEAISNDCITEALKFNWKDISLRYIKEYRDVIEV